MLTETFGDMLFAPPLGECLKELPSPEFLEKRILMSTNPPKEYKESKHEHVVKKGNTFVKQHSCSFKLVGFFQTSNYLYI